MVANKAIHVRHSSIWFRCFDLIANRFAVDSFGTDVMLMLCPKGDKDYLVVVFTILWTYIPCLVGSLFGWFRICIALTAAYNSYSRPANKMYVCCGEIIAAERYMCYSYVYLVSVGQQM